MGKQSGKWATIRKSADERFWAKVDAAGDCWEWQAAINDGGYGVFVVPVDGRGRNVRAHRWAWERLVGPIPDGMVIDHLCRNRACVNPDHLEPITRGENVLRGWTIPRRNAQKSHCPQGHPYSTENTSIELCATSSDGLMRRCRTCRAEQRARRAAA